MPEKTVEKTAAFAVTISKLAVIIYLGFVEVFKIGKLIREKLEAYFDELRLSREWAIEAYAILKKRLAKLCRLLISIGDYLRLKK